MNAVSKVHTEKIARKPYKPDPKKFESYVEWRLVNATGTYADYRKATV